jgi:hippurate hydrolase
MRHRKVSAMSDVEVTVGAHVRQRHSHVLSYMHEHHDEVRNWRHQIHQYPELAFDEHKTSELVANLLRAWGYKVSRGLAGTGVVGTLDRGQGGKRLGLRADMDALPIQERTGRPYASCRPGLMHACGHDGHTAMLLSAARFLAEQGEFDGTLEVIFQPAEEVGGGAKRMMEEGLFERHPCDAVFGMHNGPGLPQGHLHFVEGPAMASLDCATITLHGVGGHGGLPHHSVDPVVAAASLVMALQTLVSRNCDPQIAAVVSVCVLRAGEVVSVIPDTALLEVSVRALSSSTRELLLQRIPALAIAQAESFGLRADIEWRHFTPVLANRTESTQFAYGSALARFGTDQCNPRAAAVMAGEDFAYMLQQLPGSFVFIGNDDGEDSCSVHNPGYDFNDDNLVVGAAFWVGLVEDFLVSSRSAQE